MSEEGQLRRLRASESSQKPITVCDVESQSTGDDSDDNPASKPRRRIAVTPESEQPVVRRRRRPPPCPAMEQSDETQEPVAGEQPAAMAGEEPDSYDVGYGKPPRATRFRKGQSGNPKGRPKRSRNMSTMVREEMNRTLSISENGKTRRLSAIQIAFRKLVHDGIAGKPYAMRALLDAGDRYMNDEEEATTIPTLSEQDKALFLEFLGCFEDGRPPRS